MTVISGLGPLSRLRNGPARPGGAAFHVPDGATAEATGAASAVGAPTLLALQEDDADAVADRNARRHGQALLAALAAVQRGLLDGGGTAALDRLGALARAMPQAVDPRLISVQKAIQVRAAVELARARMPPAEAS